MRFIHLDQKPMHVDEAVNGMMVHQMLSGESVAFDPAHYHGPLLRYLAILPTGLAKVISGEGLSETTLRWLTALAGGLAVFSISLFRRCIGSRASWLALVLLAVSPAFIFFSRYFIHEMLFVLFSLLFLYCLWRLIEERNLRWGLLTGGLVGLLHATRETVVIVLIAATVAIIAAVWKNLEREIRWAFTREGLKIASTAILCALLVSVLFYSAFFTDLQGPVDSVLTYFSYELVPGHEKPFFYYLGLILGERTALGYLGEAWVVLFGLVGFWVAYKSRETGKSGYSFHTFLVVYVLVTTLVYSFTGYKTPWLALNIMVGWILLSGVGWAFVFEKLTGQWMRIGMGAVLVFVLGHSLFQSHRLAFRYSADPRNPYVYSHTSPDLLKLVERIEVLSSHHPDGAAMRIDIMASEYWPLPWYLREFSAIGYWETAPRVSDAPIQIYSMSDEKGIAGIDEFLFVTEMRGLRDGVLLLVAVEKNLWERQFSGN